MKKWLNFLTTLIFLFVISSCSYEGGQNRKKENTSSFLIPIYFSSAPHIWDDFELSFSSIQFLDNNGESHFAELSVKKQRVPQGGSERMMGVLETFPITYKSIRIHLNLSHLQLKRRLLDNDSVVFSELELIDNNGTPIPDQRSKYIIELDIDFSLMATENNAITLHFDSTSALTSPDDLLSTRKVVFNPVFSLIPKGKNKFFDTKTPRNKIVTDDDFNQRSEEENNAEKATINAIITDWDATEIHLSNVDDFSKQLSWPDTLPKKENGEKATEANLHPGQRVELSGQSLRLKASDLIVRVISSDSITRTLSVQPLLLNNLRVDELFHTKHLKIKDSLGTLRLSVPDAQPNSLNNVEIDSVFFTGEVDGLIISVQGFVDATNNRFQVIGVNPINLYNLHAELDFTKREKLTILYDKTSEGTSITFSNPESISAEFQIEGHALLLDLLMNIIFINEETRLTIVETVDNENKIKSFIGIREFLNEFADRTNVNASVSRLVIQGRKPFIGLVFFAKSLAVYLDSPSDGNTGQHRLMPIGSANNLEEKELNAVAMSPTLITGITVGSLSVATVLGTGISMAYKRFDSKFKPAAGMVGTVDISANTKLRNNKPETAVNRHLENIEVFQNIKEKNPEVYNVFSDTLNHEALVLYKQPNEKLQPLTPVVSSEEDIAEKQPAPNDNPLYKQTDEGLRDIAVASAEYIKENYPTLLDSRDASEAKKLLNDLSDKKAQPVISINIERSLDSPEANDVTKFTEIIANESNDELRRLELTRPGSGIKNNCLFCKIANYDPNKQLVFFDDRVSIFKDIKPHAKLHLQAVPRKHIDDVGTLAPEDIGLLNHMKLKSNEVAEKISREQGLPLEKLTQGFHVPPYISQNHLHLHTVVSPFSNDTVHKMKTDIYSNSNRLGIYRIDDVTDDLKTKGTVKYNSRHR